MGTGGCRSGGRTSSDKFMDIHASNGEGRLQSAGLRGIFAQQENSRFEPGCLAGIEGFELSNVEIEPVSTAEILGFWKSQLNFGNLISVLRASLVRFELVSGILEPVSTRSRTGLR